MGYILISRPQESRRANVSSTSVAKRDDGSLSRSALLGIMPSICLNHSRRFAANHCLGNDGLDSLDKAPRRRTLDCGRAAKWLQRSRSHVNRLRITIIIIIINRIEREKKLNRNGNGRGAFSVIYLFRATEAAFFVVKFRQPMPVHHSEGVSRAIISAFFLPFCINTAFDARAAAMEKLICLIYMERGECRHKSIKIDGMYELKMLFPPSVRLKRQTESDYSGYRSFFRIGAHISISAETKYLSLKETSSSARKKSIMALTTRKTGAPMFALDSFFSCLSLRLHSVRLRPLLPLQPSSQHFSAFLRNYRFSDRKIIARLFLGFI